MVFITELAEDVQLTPETAGDWIKDKMVILGFSDVEIVRAETVNLDNGVNALFLAETFYRKDMFFWGAHLIVDYNGKRITVFGYDNGRLDRIESTVMSLRLFDG